MEKETQKVKICLILLSSGVFLFFIPFSLKAQTRGLSISPLTFEIPANPNTTISNIIKVTNSGDSAVRVIMEAEDFVPVGEEGKVVVKAKDTRELALASWITLEPQVFNLEPNSSKTVTFRIKVPFNAEPGGHYGSVLASVGGKSSSGGSVVAQKVGALVLMRISGDAVERLQVESFFAPRFSDYGPITITARFKNTGTVHVKPAGQIYVKNIFGREVAALELPQKNVLPNSIRKVETEFNKKFLFGRYDAILTAIYGSTNEPISYVVTFWVIPWKLTLGIGITALIIIILIWRLRRRIRLAVKILFKGDKSI